MSHIRFRCVECAAASPAEVHALACAQCGSPLEVEYTAESPLLPTDGLSGLWTLQAPTPLHDVGNVVSLGEGQTPSVRLDRIGQRLGLRALYGKLEFHSPTASFKDRGSTVLVSVLKEVGVGEVVEDSSGNAGASIAAYAARAGIVAHIFAPATAPAAKLQQIKVYGAQTHLIEGPREAATRAAQSYLAERGLCYASHNLSPYFLEGTKTFAYEVAEQLKDSMPKHIVIPVGNGSLLIGAWKGFQELVADGVIGEVPHLHCVQAEAIRPIVAGFLGEDWTAQRGAGTVAGGISVAEPPRKGQAIRDIRSTGGVAVAVSDDSILRWQRLLARDEGIYAEPTSAAAFAGLEALVQQGHIPPDEPVLVPVTGLGLKDAAPA